jgi:hypothetical protein
MALIVLLQMKPDWSMLADEVLKNTPESIHFAPGSRFSWCLFQAARDDPLPELTKAVLAKLRRKYVVYLSDSEIPERMKLFRESKLVGYYDGFSFEVRAERLGPRVIKIQYSDWEGLHAGSGHYQVYRWTGSSWKVVEKSGIAVA